VADLYDDLESLPPPDRSRLERFLLFSLAGVFAYTLAAYLLLRRSGPITSTRRASPRCRMLTRTAQGIPGDPINVGLVGDNRTCSAPCRRPAGIPPIP